LGFVRTLDPILWVPSRLWFEFLGRRVNEYLEAYRMIHALAPDNLGGMALLFTHLIQATGITPAIAFPDLSLILYSLCYQPVCERFGAFFLHDLDIHTGQLSVVEDDDEKLLKVLKINRRRANTRNANAIAIDDSEEAVTLPELSELLNTHTVSFLQPMVFEDDWLSDETAMQMFQDFTSQYWLSIADAFVDQERLEPIATIEDALRRWSVEFFRQNLKTEVRFTTCHGHLTGSVRRRNKSFQQRMSFFFPPPTETCPNQLKAYVEAGMYIRKYHDFIAANEDQDVEQLNDALLTLFDKVQCLPLIKQNLWTSAKTKTGQALLIQVNSRYYKIKRIKNPPNNKNAGRSHATAHHTVIKNRIFAQVRKARLRNKQHLLRKQIRRQEERTEQATGRRARRARERRNRKKHNLPKPKRGALDLGSAESSSEDTMEEADDDSQEEEADIDVDAGGSDEGEEQSMELGAGELDGVDQDSSEEEPMDVDVDC
jgi:hypothetical protein